MIITIDGPTASGKSSVARLLGQELSIMYMNTGLLYRALAYVLLNHYGYSVEHLAHPNLDDITHIIESKDIKYTFNKEQQVHVLYQGKDLTPLLKTPLIDQASSIVSQDPQVRVLLSHVQRSIAEKHDIIIEGRDCGSVVFPHADYKFFLTAAPDIRARRWQQDQARRGIEVSFTEALTRVTERDTRDSTRPISPLVVPHHAHVIDNSHLTLEQTVEAIKKFLTLPTPA